MRDLFSDNSLGYRLRTLQLYNWGIFDRKTVTFSFDDKSTILTGLNGSGKTTTVDAILTLLVPPQKRFYNLSSESMKKRERDEKNYTLGAYGAKADEDGGGVTQYLRKKNEVISILNGIFHEEVSDRYLSLLQVRYFSGEELKCLKIITEKELRIEDITLLLRKNNTQIAQNSRWVSVLKDNVGSRLFESFSQYQNFFSDRFGFRSDNALKLFSQTVGMKVLGDITSFIRTYMLEDRSPLKEYEQLNEDFAHITKIELEMRKTEKQIELLSRTVRLGDSFVQERSGKDSLEESLDGLECWFILHALRLCENEVRKKREQIGEIERKIEANDRETEANDSLLLSLQGDDTARTIREMQKAVSEAERNENGKRVRLAEYNEIISALRKLGVTLKAVEGGEDYSENLDKIALSISDASSEKERLEEEKSSLLVETRALEDEINKVEEEIESLGKRDNNIPSYLIDIRKRMSSALSLPESELPFLGELVRVRDEESKWHESIEKLLCEEARMIIVSPEEEAAVTSFLEDNDLGNRVGIIRREEILRTGNEPELLSKIEIREKDNPLRGWLEDYLWQNYPHVFVTETEDLLRNEYAVLPSGLIRTGDRIVKDDSTDPFTKKTPLYLGWSNRQRIGELTGYLYDMTNERDSFRMKTDMIVRNIRDRELILKKLEALLQFRTYDEIDRPGALRILEEKRRELDAFLTSHSDYREIERKIKQAEEKKRRLKSEYGILSSDKGAGKLELQKLEENMAALRKNEEKAGETEKIAAFVSSRTNELSYDSLDSLMNLHDSLFGKIRLERDEKEKKCSELEHRLVTSMNSFLNPPLSLVASDINWSGEFSSLVAEAVYYPDYKELYERKKDEDISSLRDDFNSFLEKTLSNVIGTLSEALNSWEKEIHEAVRILNRNLMRIPFNREVRSHLRLEERRTGDRDYRTFRKMLSQAIPDRLVLLGADTEGRRNIYGEIRKFLEKYNADEKLKRRVLDIRNIYTFTVYEDNADGNVATYSDTAALSGGEKAKLTYTILASALCYQYNLDNEDETRKGPFRFVILDEAFSRSDANNSIYALELFRQLDLQLMVVTPRNGINLVEGYVNSLHLIEKKSSTGTSGVSSMTIEEYRKEQ